MFTNDDQLREAMLAKRVLVVDDEDPIRDFLRDVLEDEGYSVDTAATGQAALAIVHHHLPDLILTDLMMPGMDGQELCRHLRATPGATHLPIILMTAANQPHITALFTAVITKPFTLVTLLERISTALVS